jgi:branched-chain amino acid transport system substrate-binding protein
MLMGGNMLKRTLLAGATSLGLALLLAAAPAQAQIKIGTAGPITGSNASFGAQLKAGAEQAVADINAKGGVLGKKLELVVGDDACDPKPDISVRRVRSPRARSMRRKGSCR